MRSPSERLLVGLLLASLLAAPALAIDLSAPPEDLAEQKRSWVERIQRDQRAVEDAESDYANAVERYQRMKIRRKERGDERAAIVERMEAAEQALADAHEALEATMREARRAGVPPGWLRDAAESGPAPASTD